MLSLPGIVAGVPSIAANTPVRTDAPVTVNGLIDRFRSFNTSVEVSPICTWGKLRNGADRDNTGAGDVPDSTTLFSGTAELFRRYSVSLTSPYEPGVKITVTLSSKGTEQELLLTTNSGFLV